MVASSGLIIPMKLSDHQYDLGVEVRDGGGYLPIYGIVRMWGPNSPLFKHCQVYNKPPFSKKKYMTDPVFHHCYILFVPSDIQPRNQNCNIYLYFTDSKEGIKKLKNSP